MEQWFVEKCASTYVLSATARDGSIVFHSAAPAVATMHFQSAACSKTDQSRSFARLFPWTKERVA